MMPMGMALMHTIQMVPYLIVMTQIRYWVMLTMIMIVMEHLPLTKMAILVDCDDSDPNLYGENCGTSCLDLATINGSNATSGTYEILPEGYTEPIDVYCDMTTSGGEVWALLAYENDFRFQCEWVEYCYHHNVRFLWKHTGRS